MPPKKKKNEPKKKKEAPPAKSEDEIRMDREMFEKAEARAKELDEKKRQADDKRKAEEAAAAAELREKYGLSDVDLAEFREMFNLVDADGGGTIGRDEVLSLMQTVGYSATEEEVDEMINEIDQDGNGEIDFDEFVVLMSRKPDALRKPDEIRAAFRLFEKCFDDKPGCIRESTLTHALTNLCADKLTTAEARPPPPLARDLIAQLPGADAEGFINYQDYISMMSTC